MSDHGAGAERASVLREVRGEDLDVLFAFRTDPEAVRMARILNDPPTRAIFDGWWAYYRNDPLVIAGTIESDGQVAGYIFSREHFGEREVEFWVGREYWGQGIATAALAAFLELERDRPVYAEVAGDNVRALHVLGKFGFEVEQEGFNDTVREGKAPILLLVTGLHEPRRWRPSGNIASGNIVVPPLHSDDDDEGENLGIHASDDGRWPRA